VTGRFAVVGHVEWAQFARVAELPAPGAIVHASEGWEAPGGGGAAAALGMADLAGSALFLTAHWSGESLPRGRLSVRTLSDPAAAPL
jgi:ribokinase